MMRLEHVLPVAQKECGQMIQYMEVNIRVGTQVIHFGGTVPDLLVILNLKSLMTIL